MKVEITAEPELNAFAQAQAGKSNTPSNGNGPNDPKPFTWIGGPELSRMEPRRNEMVVQNIMPAGGLTLNASKSKTGKTTLMVEICHAVATDRPALGKYAVKHGPVLYWLADDSNVNRFSETWRIVTNGEDVVNFQLCVVRQHLHPDGIINLRKAAQEFQPVLIVADSYTTIRTPHPKGCDFVKAEYDDMRRLSELAAETGAAICLIHHQSKAKQTDPFDAVAGSYAMSAGADGRMIVEKLHGTERLVRVDGRDLDEFQLVYARNADRRLFHVIDGPSADHWERLHLIAGRYRDTSFTTKDAGEAFGVSDRQAKRVLNQWEYIGALLETERGRFVLDGQILAAVTRLKNECGK